MTRLDYNSFEQFLADAMTARKELPKRYIFEHDNSFAGCTFDEALEYASRGWREGTEQIHTLSARLVSNLTSLIEVPQLAYDVTGADFDVGLYCSGRPECWYYFESVYQEGIGTGILKMTYNIGAQWNVSASAMVARGVVAASLITLLERCGRRVELWAVNSVRGNCDADIRIPVKAADQDMDIDRLAFILVNPAMLRRLSFAVRMLKCGASHMGAGASQQLPVQEQGDIYFPAGIGAEWVNPDSALAYVKQELRKQGIEVGE